ncbi:MAG: YdcF family protein [Candidatus Woesearchaeota archaeon]
MSNYKTVMIVLGCSPRKDGRPSDEMISRVRKAVSLYKKNNYSKIIFSGGPTRGVPESVVMRLMVLNYLPDNKIITEKNSRSTVQNAVFCWELLKGHKPKSITIVTSDHHMPRAKHIFKKIYHHMGCTLKFEGSPNTFDPIEGVFYRSKEFIALSKIRLLGVR